MNSLSSPGGTVCAIACGDSGVFCAIDYGGVARTTDNGTSWTFQNDGISDLRMRGIAVSTGGAIVAIAFGGSVYRSTDNGNHWTTLSATIQGSNATPVVAGSNGVMYASADSKLFKSTDNGATWTEFDKSGVTSTAYSLTVRPDGNAMSGVFNGVQWTEDGGVSWNFTATIFCTACPYLVVVWSVATTQQGIMFAGSHYGIERNTGGRWLWQDTGFPDGLPAVRCIAADPSGRVFAGTEGAGIFESLDNGETWAPENDSLSDGDVRCLASTRDGFVFAGTFIGGVFRSRNSTLTVIPPLLSQPRNDTLYIPTTTQLRWRPSPLAQSYRVQVSASPSFSPLLVDSSGVADTTMLVSGLGSDSMYFWRIGAVRDTLMRFSDVYRFATGPVQPPQLEYPANGMSVPTNVVFSWFPSAGADRYNITIVDTVTGSVTGSGSTTGLAYVNPYLLPGKGYRWSVVGFNNVTSTSSVPSESRAFTTTPSTSVELQEGSRGSIPVDFVIVGNYPNPFNPSTIIKFGVPIRAFVRLEVYNLVGQRVAQLVAGEREAGFHEALFDASDLASGMYFCRLQAGGRAFSRKVLLVR